MKMTEEQTLELAKEIVKVLEEKVEWEPEKIENPTEIYMKWFREVGFNYLIENTPRDFGQRAFEYGISVADRVSKNITLEEVQKIWENENKLNELKDIIEGKIKGEKLGMSPFVKVFKDCGFCGNCDLQAYDLCDGTEEVNMVDLINPKAKMC